MKTSKFSKISFFNEKLTLSYNFSEDFGFQVNWSKPISIGSVTKSTPAEKNLEVGDLVIFIENSE